MRDFHPARCAFFKESSLGYVIWGWLLWILFVVNTVCWKKRKDFSYTEVQKERISSPQQKWESWRKVHSAFILSWKNSMEEKGNTQPLEFLIFKVFLQQACTCTVTHVRLHTYHDDELSKTENIMAGEKIKLDIKLNQTKPKGLSLQLKEWPAKYLFHCDWENVSLRGVFALPWSAATPKWTYFTSRRTE